MRANNYLLATLKETPADAEVISHQLMLRAGMIRKLASGLYTWLPLGTRVLRKVSQVVREEMDRSGAMEVSMPVVQHAELWEESGRWHSMGPELFGSKTGTSGISVWALLTKKLLLTWSEVNMGATSNCQPTCIRSRPNSAMNADHDSASCAPVNSS